MLAEDMGTGKTVCIIGLILKSKGKVVNIDVSPKLLFFFLLVIFFIFFFFLADL